MLRPECQEAIPQLAILSYLKTDSKASASSSCSSASTHFGSDNECSDGPFAGIGDLYNVLEAVSSMSVHEPSDSEANLVMDVVRAKCNVFLTQKTLVDCILRENEVFASLLKFRAEAAERK
ncbi:hypothetical protein DFJ58DRAFT_842604 [Suillus subalutaceus]|uniref:uncharacterized protein n=1 Tax=Suillus subalutaceus TaxID=48586 RepID=UPI001B85B46A|nr:uncharacterized protein DFJ58DRAFT_842604 [Suillus subalutaceus]KAG1849667.1 hypothetical protein DFJ58DRAFT_842604 [Suillus subalutaceus]